MAENGKQWNYPNQKSAQGCCGQNQGGCEAHQAPNQELVNAPVLVSAGLGGFVLFSFFLKQSACVRACVCLVVERGWEGKKGEKKAKALPNFYTP